MGFVLNPADDEKGLKAQASERQGTGSSAGTVSFSAIAAWDSRVSSTVQEGGLAYWHSVARIRIWVAEAQQYAADQGVLHRDIKLANLLLDLNGNVWVTDFGLAKSNDSDELTNPGDTVGTLRYLAPERLKGASELSSDISGLIATLYELLVPRPLFDGVRREQLLNWRIPGLLVSCDKIACAVSGLSEKLVGSSGFDPCTEADHGFGVFAEPVGRIAFDSKVDNAAQQNHGLGQRTSLHHRNIQPAFQNCQFGRGIDAVILLQIGDLAFNIYGHIRQPLILFAHLRVVKDSLRKPLFTESQGSFPFPIHDDSRFPTISESAHNRA